MLAKVLDIRVSRVFLCSHILLTDSLPHDLRAGKKTDQEMGVTCMSLGQELYRTTGTFLIGSESGGIFKCSTNAKGNVVRSKGEIYDWGDDEV